MAEITDMEFFLDTLLVKGLEAFKKYVGPYRANVIRNDDPEERGRIQIICPRAGHSAPLNKWVKPSFDGAGGNRGLFWPPEVGDSVFVFFSNGDPGEPELYIGGWHGPDDVPEEFAYSEQTVTNSTAGKQQKKVPERRGLRTRKGHRLVFTDENGQETIELTWNKPIDSDPAISADASGVRDETYADGETATLRMDSTGSITVRASNGAVVEIKTDGTLSLSNAEGSTMVMSGKTITVTADTVNVDASRSNISGTKYSAVLGELLLNWLASHVHPTPTGMSSPPLQPPPKTILSKKVYLG